MQNVNIVFLSPAQFETLDEGIKSRFSSDYAKGHAEPLPGSEGVERISRIFRLYDHLVVAENDGVFGSKRNTYEFMFRSKGLFQHLEEKFPGSMDQIKKIFLPE